MFRQLHRCRTAGVRYRDHHINVEIGVLTFDFIRKTLAHSQARFVDRNAVHHRIRPRQIHKFKNTRIERRHRRALLAVKLAIHIDEYRFARRHIAYHFIAHRIQRYTFRRHHVFKTGVRFNATKNQRAYAERITKRQHAVPRYHRHHGIRPLATAMHTRHRCKNRRRIKLVIGGAVLQLVRQHIQQHLRIRAGIDVTQIRAEQINFELLGIGEIAIVAEHNTEGRIHIKRLRFRYRRRCARSRITRVRDTCMTA